MRCHHLVLPSPSPCPFHSHDIVTQNYQLKCENSQTQTWTADFARPLCAKRPERPYPRWIRGSALGRGATPRASRARKRSRRKQPFARRTLINETGDAVPGRQDSITRGIHKLQLADIPAAQPDHAVRAPPNSGLAIKERSSKVLSAARARVYRACRWWSHGAHESKAWRPATGTKKCSPVATA